MAYVTSEQVKAVRKEIKKQFPGFKFSITKEHCTSISISLMSANLEIKDAYQQLNHYYLDEYSDSIRSVFEKVKEIMFSVMPYYDRSDSMTDYFETAYYYNFNIGKWNKPYIQK